MFNQQNGVTRKCVASSPPCDEQTSHKKTRRNSNDIDRSSDSESTPLRGRPLLRDDDKNMLASSTQGSKSPLVPSLQLSANNEDEGDDTLPDLGSDKNDDPHEHSEGNLPNQEGGNGENEAIKSLGRIREAIEYTRSRISKGLPLMQTTRFVIRLKTARHKPSDAETYIFELLEDSPATIILVHPDYVVYELGIHPPDLVVAAVGVVVSHTPQWWIGRSAAHIRAGPWADAVDLRKAEAKVKEMETKRRKQKPRYKTLRQEETESKLREGLRRQNAGAAMCSDE